MDALLFFHIMKNYRDVYPSVFSIVGGILNTSLNANIQLPQFMAR